jgi:hypothetical protein
VGRSQGWLDRLKDELSYFVPKSKIFYRTKKDTLSLMKWCGDQAMILFSFALSLPHSPSQTQAPFGKQKGLPIYDPTQLKVILP